MDDYKSIIKSLSTLTESINLDMTAVGEHTFNHMYKLFSNSLQELLDERVIKGYSGNKNSNFFSYTVQFFSSKCILTILVKRKN